VRTVRIAPTLEAWRAQARRIILARISPGELLWSDEREAAGYLFASNEGSDLPAAPGSFNAPREFLSLTKSVACHRSPERWGRLYRVLWRLVVERDIHLLRKPNDDDVRALETMAKAIGRDRHKMTAFVRFRKVGEDAETGREQFVAWFEPDHYIVELTAPFFVKRFTGMDWSILTPDKCIHWDGETLHTTAGVTKAEAPDEDALDALWLSYYRSIFNPARLKMKAMQAGMPKKYWKNLPEASLIHELMVNASQRSEAMIAKDATTPSALPNNAYIRSLHERKEAPALSDIEPLDAVSMGDMRSLAETCRACPLWEKATQTVFGEGPEDAEIMIIGEHPGDEEDLRGKPFQGPSGQSLDKALKEVGIDRSAAYVTNAVKHFKWQPRGKRRLHQSPNQAEVGACRPWILAEIKRVKPKVVLCLGATAAQSVISPDFKITRERGLVSHEGLASCVIATVHPSYILRQKEEMNSAQEYARFIDDLRLAGHPPTS
jgi:probable DNA metabolism protein